MTCQISSQHPKVPDLTRQPKAINLRLVEVSAISARVASPPKFHPWDKPWQFDQLGKSLTGMMHRWHERPFSRTKQWPMAMPAVHLLLSSNVLKTNKSLVKTEDHLQTKCFTNGQKFQKVENDENRFFAITSSKLFKNWFCKGHIFSNNIFHNHCFLYVL